MEKGSGKLKTLLCGKGGSGKSTLTALISKSLSERGCNVLVIDNDESNFGLHRQLGLELPDDFLNFLGGKKSGRVREQLIQFKYYKCKSLF